MEINYTEVLGCRTRRLSGKPNHKEKRRRDQGGQGKGKSRGREGERRGLRKGKKKEGA